MARNEEPIPYGPERPYKRADGAMWVYSHKDSSIALHGTTSSVQPRKSLFRMAEKYLGPEWCPDLPESRLSSSKRRLEDWLNGENLDFNLLLPDGRTSLVEVFHQRPRTIGYMSALLLPYVLGLFALAAGLLLLRVVRLPSIAAQGLVPQVLLIAMAYAAHRVGSFYTSRLCHRISLYLIEQKRYLLARRYSRRASIWWKF